MRHLLASIILLFTLSSMHSQDVSLIDSLVQVTKTSKNDSVLMVTFNKLRRATYYNDVEASQEYTFKFLEYARKREDSLHIAFAHFYLGNSYVQSNNLEVATEEYLKASEYYERVNDLKRLPSVFNAIGAVHEKRKDAELALKYYEKSLDLSLDANDNRRASIALINISNIYQNQGNYFIAIEKLEESLNLMEAHRKVDTTVDLTQQEQIAKLNLANAYEKAGDYSASKMIFSDLIENSDSLSNKYVYVHGLEGLGKVYVKENKNEEGVQYLEQAFKSYTYNNFNEDRYVLMMDLINAYEATGQNEKALNLFYEYSTIKDSIFNTDKDKNLNEVLQKYEAEKKDNEILEQSLTIEKKNKQQNKILISLIALALVSISGFYLFRKRIQYKSRIASQNEAIQKQKITELQQKNKLVAMNSMIEGQEAERLRIAKDLHDSLGGLLSTVKAHFTTIQNEVSELEDLQIAAKTNGLIDEACVEVRRISHNMMPHALSISGLKGAVEDIGAHLSEQGYTTKVEIANLPEEMPPTQDIMIYRLLQEIISNIRKHANAKTILIQMLGHQDGISLTIEDDGKGFNYEQALLKGGLGLKSINSRVEFLDGTAYWDTALGRGTTLTLNIPT